MKGQDAIVVSGIYAGAMIIRPAACALFIASMAAAQQPSRSVALTFDDLPFAERSDARSAAGRALTSNQRIQRALRRYSAPAIGFVNEAKVEALGPAGLAIVKSWNRGSFELGNHGFAHLDSNDLTLGQIEQEIVKGERTIKPLAQQRGRSLRFYRLAFNHVGDTQQKQAAIAHLLARHGYKLAASTIDTSDYVFASAYSRALAQNDAAMQKRIADLYVAYTRQEIDYYAQLNARVLGYEPPEIMLLHLSRLNAATLDRVLQVLHDLNYRFVTLEQAQSGPAYRQSPAFATTYGPMWAYRWAHDRGTKVDGSLEKDPPAWVANYAAGEK